MAEMIELKEQEERVILVAVSTGEDDDTAASVDELEELASTAGAVTVGKVIQNRENVHPGTYLGKGKIEEVKELLWELDATGIICDDELSPAQLKNLEDTLDTKVMDLHHGDPGYFRIPGQDQGGKDPGGAGPAPVPGRAPGGAQKFPVPSGRRDRHQGTGREEAGGGPASDP